MRRYANCGLRDLSLVDTQETEEDLENLDRADKEL